MSSMKLPATIENMESLVQFISDKAGEFGFSGKRVKEIELASEEALVNIINYAYPDLPGDITVTCTREPSNTFVIDIEDTGMAFNMLSLKDPDTSACISEREIGGLGVFLIRKLMDDVHYHRDNDKNFLRLIVRGPQSESAGEKSCES
jgi:serine/threonine-protein kinase RsbW